MAINLFTGCGWPLWASLSGVCSRRQLAWWLLCDITQHKEADSELPIDSTQKQQQLWFCPTSQAGFKLAPQMTSRVIMISSSQDEPRTGKLKKQESFNDIVSKIDPICLAVEELLLIFQDLINISNISIFRVSPESSLAEAPPHQFNQAASVCRQITAGLHTTYALSSVRYSHLVRTQQWIFHKKVFQEAKRGRQSYTSRLSPNIPHTPPKSQKQLATCWFGK